MPKLKHRFICIDCKHTLYVSPQKARFMDGQFCEKCGKGGIIHDGTIRIAEQYAADNCNECEYLYQDKDKLRCKLFGDAIIEEPTEKHCKDSM